MAGMFYGARAFNADLSAWDVSRVTDVRSMFADAHSFNGDLSAWDVSSATDMTFLFNNAHTFNCDLSAWNVSRVTDMANMFSKAYAFKGDLRFVATLLAFSADAHAEVYTYDGLTEQGTVTVFQPFVSTPLTPLPPRGFHGCIALRFYKRDGEFRWHNPESDEVNASVAEQLTLTAFLQQTMHGVYRSNGRRDMHKTRKVVETAVLGQLLIDSNRSVNDAGTLLYVTGCSWAEKPPMKVLMPVDDYDPRDILCRSNALTGHEWDSLAVAMIEACPTPNGAYQYEVTLQRRVIVDL